MVSTWNFCPILLIGKPMKNVIGIDLSSIKFIYPQLGIGFRKIDLLICYEALVLGLLLIDLLLAMHYWMLQDLWKYGPFCMECLSHILVDTS